MTLPELLLPAGNLAKLRMALVYGADAVYVGAAGLSMRPDEAAFTVDKLGAAVELAHGAGRRIYVALNTLMFDADLDPLRTWMDQTSALDMDAVIVSDPGAMGVIREMRPALNIHVSTQASTANSGTAAFWESAGASRVVLARECTLESAKTIAGTSGIDVEVFVHGAMCVAVSGRCLLSAHMCGQSGNRGTCKHSCRWEWEIAERKRPGETFSVVQTERETVFFGSTDLCLIEHIPLLVDSGVKALKVEGRMKSEYYVANVTRVYRAALDRYARDPNGFTVDPGWLAELDAVSHRPYGTGFAFGYPDGHPDSIQTHNAPESTCDVLGHVTDRSGDTHTIEVKNPFSVDETIEWIAPLPGAAGSLTASQGTVTVAQILGENGRPRERSHCGTVSTVTFTGARCFPVGTCFRRRHDPSLALLAAT